MVTHSETVAYEWLEVDDALAYVIDGCEIIFVSTVKGRYVTKATITSTMNPGVPVDPTVIA